MPTLLVALTLIIGSVAAAQAGPYCGSKSTFAPHEDTTLPVAPTVSFSIEDDYYNGKRQRSAKLPAIRATIDGKRVSVATRDLRTRDGLLRIITIKSRRTGKLELTTRDRWGAELGAAYTIAADAPTTDSPSVAVLRKQDTRLGPYRWIGELVALRIDAPAIAFTIRWRRDADDAWRTQHVAPVIEEIGHSEAWLGQRMCGMAENVPLAFLERGIELQLTATLPSGRAVSVTEGLPLPLVLPPKAQRP